ncbi:hypothetical protein BGW38_000868 [Lunasporangiospora selenospora]|uniref:Uncharacterized protein n=1 Tax=Lunasporangiospora selenospora TaxID=979761 RepID=A0A9P6KEH9_9FUNG|nr:hypothetical protein BGW38_000868 [Lunasporangiospora selenospora]
MTPTTTATPTPTPMATHAKPDQAKSRTVSRKLFFLVAYSLTTAALMGSSIGLVDYQAHQFLVLRRLLRRSCFVSANVVATAAAETATAGTTANTALLQTEGCMGHGHHFGHNRHDPSHEHHHHGRLKVLFLTTGVPVLVWVASLLVTAYVLPRGNPSSLSTKARSTSGPRFGARQLRRVQRLVRTLSPRTGILISQCLFALFWVLLGTVQEVQEQIMTRLYQPLTSSPGSGFGVEVDVDTARDYSGLLVSLRVVWYGAIVLLGVATGLLTTSSGRMEQALGRAYWEAQQPLETPSEKESTPITVSTPSENPTPGFTTRQRCILGLLILAVFFSQTRLFGWILEAQSRRAYKNGTEASVASMLTEIGLIFGGTMVYLGVRYMPVLAVDDENEEADNCKSSDGEGVRSLGKLQNA